MSDIICKSRDKEVLIFKYNHNHGANGRFTGSGGSGGGTSGGGKSSAGGGGIKAMSKEDMDYLRARGVASFSKGPDAMKYAKSDAAGRIKAGSKSPTVNVYESQNHIHTGTVSARTTKMMAEAGAKKIGTLDEKGNFSKVSTSGKK